MAVKVNGALIVEQVYEFGCKILNEPVDWVGFENAICMVEVSPDTRKLYMRVHYITEEMEAQ